MVFNKCNIIKLLLLLPNLRKPQVYLETPPVGPVHQVWNHISEQINHLDSFTIWAQRQTDSVSVSGDVMPHLVTALKVKNMFHET